MAEESKVDIRRGDDRLVAPRGHFTRAALATVDLELASPDRKVVLAESREGST